MVVVVSSGSVHGNNMRNKIINCFASKYDNHPLTRENLKYPNCVTCLQPVNIILYLIQLRYMGFLL